MGAHGAFLILLLQCTRLATAGQHEFIYRKEPQPIGSRRPICKIDEDRGECNLDQKTKEDAPKVFSKVKVAAPLITVPPRSHANHRQVTLTGLCPVLKAEHFRCATDYDAGELKVSLSDLGYGSVSTEITLKIIEKQEMLRSAFDDKSNCASFNCPAGWTHEVNAKDILCPYKLTQKQDVIVREYNCTQSECCKEVPPTILCYLKSVALVYSEVDELSLRFDYDRCQTTDPYKKASLMVGLKKVAKDDQRLIRPRTNTSKFWQSDIKNFFHGVCKAKDYNFQKPLPDITPTVSDTTEAQVFPTATTDATAMSNTSNTSGASRRLEKLISNQTNTTLNMYGPTDFKVGLASHVRRENNSMPRYPCFMHTVDVQYIHATPGCYDDMLMLTATAPDGVDLSSILVPEDDFYDLLGVAKALKANHSDKGISDPCKPIKPGVPGVIIADRMCVELEGCAQHERANPYHCDNRCFACSVINPVTVTTTTGYIPNESQCQKCFWPEMVIFILLAFITAGVAGLFKRCLSLKEPASGPPGTIAHAAIFQSEFDTQTGFTMAKSWGAGQVAGAPALMKKFVAKTDPLKYLAACLVLLIVCFAAFATLLWLFWFALDETFDFPAECPCHVWWEKIGWAFMIWGLACFILGWILLRREVVLELKVDEEYTVGAQYGGIGSCNVQ